MSQPAIQRQPASAAVRPSAGRVTTPTALVVDGNVTSRRFVELSLARAGGFAVEEAGDAAAALEILRTQLVDLVVSDTDLPDATGLAFHRRLAQESRLRHVPFVFLSADRAVATKVAALKAGADDYLVKPCDAAELVARAEALVGRQRRMRDAMRSRSYALAGDFGALGFSELVSTIGMGRRSGVLSVVTSDAVGRVYFDGGAVVHASFGNLSGELAFQRMFGEPNGHFEFMPGDCPIVSTGWTIEESVTGLIMEAARVLDDDARRAADAPSASVRVIGEPPARMTTVPPRASMPPEPPLAPDTILAAQLELALREPFALGDLRVFTEPDLARWTRRDVGGARLHVLLVADLAAGVSAMLGLGGAATERWVLDSLSPAKKAFALTFFLRHERMVDLVLVDVRAPAELIGSLSRVPSVMLFCPPDGDLFALGIAARVGLEELLTARTPPALVTVGNGNLERGLGAMAPISSGAVAVRRAPGALGGENADDLRELLIKGVRLWASTAKPGIRERPTLPPGAT